MQAWERPRYLSNVGYLYHYHTVQVLKKGSHIFVNSPYSTSKGCAKFRECMTSSSWMHVQSSPDIADLDIRKILDMTDF